MFLSESYKKRLQELAGLVEVDFFHTDGEDFAMDDDDAVPFLYYEDKLYLRRDKEFGGDFYYGQSHWDIVRDVLAKAVENGFIVIEPGEDGNSDWSSYEQDMMDDTNYNGRLWIDKKIISFWKMPRDRFELKDIVEDLNDESGGEFHIDGSWRIRIGMGRPDKLISLSDYTGGEISVEEKKDLEDKWKQHIMSPLLKSKMGLNKVPQGFGSKNPSYAGKRIIDLALGRAE